MNLGSLLIEARQFEEAELLFRRALTIHGESFGSDHPVSASTLNALANVLQHTGRYSEAEHLIRQALVIDEARLGPFHPDVANRLHNLGLFLLQSSRAHDSRLFLADSDRESEVESLLRRSLCILAKSSADAGHPVIGLKKASTSYRRFLDTTGVKRADAERQIVDLLMRHGLSRKKAKQLART